MKSKHSLRPTGKQNRDSKQNSSSAQKEGNQMPFSKPSQCFVTERYDSKTYLSKYVHRRKELQERSSRDYSLNGKECSSIGKDCSQNGIHKMNTASSFQIQPHVQKIQKFIRHCNINKYRYLKSYLYELEASNSNFKLQNRMMEELIIRESNCRELMCKLQEQEVGVKVSRLQHTLTAIRKKCIMFTFQLSKKRDQQAIIQHLMECKKQKQQENQKYKREIAYYHARTTNELRHQEEQYIKEIKDLQLHLLKLRSENNAQKRSRKQAAIKFYKETLE